MAIEHSITFGGVNSADFGIYISGEGVFNAPKRDVEMISIPGRNGEIALDKGRYENIEVTYPAFNYEADYSDFAQNLADFRNAICSQVGYQRLTDTFHPDEYRMATYIDGLEIKPIKYNTASEFEITFNCKPQRWLTSGETPVAITSGDELTNPTLYESSPLLEVGGYGHIQMGDDSVNIENLAIGNVILANSGTARFGRVDYDQSAYALLKPTDNVVLQAGTVITLGIYVINDVGVLATDGVTALAVSIGSSSPVACHVAGYSTITRGRSVQIVVDEPLTTTKNGGISVTIPLNISFTYKYQNVTYTWEGIKYYRIISYSFGEMDFDLTVEGDTEPSSINISRTAQNADIIGESTNTVTGDHPLFIDCDLGEAYTIIDGEISSLNAYIDLGSDLPTLGTGANEITYDNTVTELKISPRWWQL